MAYDEELAIRIRTALPRREGIAERKMFGGIAFMLRGNMFCGVVKDTLMVRVGRDEYESALARPHARPMDFAGRPMRGMVFVGPKGCCVDNDLQSWLERGLKFVDSLPDRRPSSHTL